MIYRSFLLSTLLLMSGCAYLDGRATQELTIVTPGAQGAVCYAYVDGVKYRVKPPQTINIKKSRDDLRVDCLAPGNRREEVIIEAGYEEQHIKYNLLNGLVPGVAWDTASGAIFKYPDIVEVSFVGAPVLGEDLPAQNNPDIKQPEEYDLEEFKAGQPRMNSDRYATQPELRRRERNSETLGVYDQNSNIMPSDSPGGKAQIDKTIDSLGGAMDPAGEASSDGAPVPLYPGQ